ncbi:voltage-gated potassium channel [Asanoa ferruginea]|uniref:Voltage-gated potassium channel n=1 Tax=Asanoa ferruginea TaxID=53367 RepID=A0A3D9ZIY1_9ACTN|nr:potassium channel family protein [Asanoa ferruginea]REF96809.1 voltage-gated potassium channel [Asanoa ferruginea]GIF51060.1 putative transmembrane cation transporter [Asanoa ferruginea]
MIHFPRVRQSPLRALGIRLFAAIGLVLLIVLVVFIDRRGYRDITDTPLSLLDCAYYAVVTLSTTGYGDITPISQSARLVNVLVITPARVLFLIILVGTTLEVLTEQYRTNLRLTRWRKTVKDHVIVCGYGTKGRSAVNVLLENGMDKRKIVVVENSPAALRSAIANGLVGVEGSATRSAVLLEAHVKDAKSVIIATHSDDAAVLVTLTVRQLTAGKVRIIAAAREAENAPLLKQSGAHHVIVSASTAGRLLGLSTSAPPLIDVVEDLLTPGQGMALAMRSAERQEVGQAPRDLDPLVIALVRRGKVVSLAEPAGLTVETGDMLVYVRDDRSASLSQ